MDLKNPTFEQLREAAKRRLPVSFKRTTEHYLDLRTNEINKDMVFVQDALGQGCTIARDGKIEECVSDIVIEGFYDEK